MFAKTGDLGFLGTLSKHYFYIAMPRFSICEVSKKNLGPFAVSTEPEEVFFSFGESVS